MLVEVDERVPQQTGRGVHSAGQDLEAQVDQDVIPQGFTVDVGADHEADQIVTGLRPVLGDGGAKSGQDVGDAGHRPFEFGVPPPGCR